jgi:hypothetical protein
MLHVRDVQEGRVRDVQEGRVRDVRAACTPAYVTTTRRPQLHVRAPWERLEMFELEMALV